MSIESVDVGPRLGVESAEVGTIPGRQGDPGPGLAPKGHVANAAARPASPALGDAWVTDDDGHLSAWDGANWVDMGQWRGDAGAGVPATSGAAAGDAILYDGATSVWGQVDWSKLKNKPAVIGAGATAADARTAIGAGTSSFSGAYTDLSGKPSTFPPTIGNTAATAMAGNKTATDLGGASSADSRFVGVPVSAQTAAYTLVAGDAGSIVEVNSASAVSVTVPASTFAAGQIVEVCQMGAGQVTIVAGSGVTLRNANGLKISAQYGSASIRFRSATEAVVAGALST